MVNLQRTLLFFIGCLGSRFFIAYLAKVINSTYLQMMGYIALIPAMGFLLIYVFGLRKTGMEVSGEKIWWNNYRPIHSLDYFIFAYLAISKSNNAWKMLFMDAVLGLILYLNHYYIQ